MAVPAQRSNRRTQWVLSMLVLFLMGSLFLSGSLGDKRIDPATVSLALLGVESEATRVDAIIVRDIRLPRALSGALVGAALALSGGVMQAIFRNPLADPGLIGVSAGGALGAVGFIVFSAWLIPEAWGWLRESGLILFPMLGGALVTFLVYKLSQVNGRTHVTTLLLTGLAMNALVGALIGYAVYLASDEQLRDFTFWSLGSLGRTNWQVFQVLAPVMLALCFFVSRFRRRLNLLVLGESEALHLGVDVESTRRQLILATAMVVGLTVSICGMIGFVGLVTPHLCRLLLGSDHRVLLPASALLGAGLLVQADLLARIAIRYSELPVGVVTATIGAPFFLYLIAVAKRRAALS